MTPMFTTDSNPIESVTRRGVSDTVLELLPTQREGLLQSLRTAVVLFLLLTAITGIAYPLTVTLVAQVAFPDAASGSLIREGSNVIGSELVGQSFDDPRYFWGRPSATTPAYNGLGGSGSNLATTNPALLEAVHGRIDRLHAADPDNKSPIPVDLVTASASGLDPHLSPAGAAYQTARLAHLRGIPLDRINGLIKEHTEMPTLGFLGQPRVHILRLNVALDAAK